MILVTYLMTQGKDLRKQLELTNYGGQSGKQLEHMGGSVPLKTRGLSLVLMAHFVDDGLDDFPASRESQGIPCACAVPGI